MPSRRSRMEKNHAKKIAKLNDDSCAIDRESQDIECEERDSFQEAREKKNTFERNRYKANSESKKDSMKAYYDQNRELILASKQDQYQANPKAKRDISRINTFRKRNSTR